MLCDDIIHNPILGALDNFDLMTGKIAAANKFVLDHDFAVAADGLVDNNHELKRIQSFCRIPYRMTWIEFAQADRPSFLSADLGPVGAQPSLRRVKRVGFMLEATNDEMTKWIAHLFWSFNSPDIPQNSPLNYSTCFLASLFDLTVEYDHIAIVAPAQYGMETLGIDGFDSARALIAAQQNDWGGEARFLLATLGLLNARNVADTVTVDKSEHNRKRAKRGQLPLYSHTILKVRMSHRQHKGSKSVAQTDHVAMRAHFVRGHFKIRKTGTYWWGPFMRGSLDAGYVGKEYELDK